MTGADPEAEAQQILRTQGITRPPVPVEQIARAMGVRVAFEPFEGDLSGMLYQDPGNEDIIILVNSLNAKTRQRFSIAHELGHLVLHERNIYVDRPISVRFRDALSSLAVSREEIEANQFGAALLMPQEWVLVDAHRRLSRQPGTSDEQLVEELARQYDVSRAAMEFRLSNLGIWSPL
ncbi:MAG: ImmA/IrrE family metallo-endopeptidase [Chloroflexota bacterium]|nr:ImmA/IrrE family metallo-endopeptidase [Chloroflexota bacterium]